MQATARCALPSTGLLIPRLHKLVPQSFNDDNRAIIEDLLKAKLIRPSTKAYNLDDVVEAALLKAGKMDYTDAGHCFITHNDAGPKFDVTIWNGATRLPLGDLLTYLFAKKGREHDRDLFFWISGVIQPDGEAIDVAAFVLGLNSAKRATTSVNFIDPRVVATGPGWVAWWRERQITTVFIRGVKNRVTLPPLLFVGGKKMRRVWVLPKNERPNRDTELRLTGWSNTYEDGGICWGSGREPATLEPSDWEDAFFASSFDSKRNLHSNGKTKFNKALGPALEALGRPN